MNVELVGRVLSTLPEDDDHPYRTGPWRPQTTEWNADDLDGGRGRDPGRPRRRLPPQHREPGPPGARSSTTRSTATAWCTSSASATERRSTATGSSAPTASRPRMESGGALWAGISEPPQIADRDGWGARTRMKDASQHRRRGAPRRRPDQLLPVRRPVPARPVLRCETWARRPGTARFPCRLGRVGPPEGRRAHRRAAVLQLQQGSAVHAVRRGRREQRPRALRGRAAARPAAAARHGVHRELRDPERLPAVLGPEAAGRRTSTRPGSTGTCRPGSRSFRAAATTEQIRWFEAEATYVLHFVNAYEDGRRDRARRLLPGRPRARRHRPPGHAGSGRSVSWPSTGCRPGCTAGASTSAPAWSRSSS